MWSRNNERKNVLTSCNSRHTSTTTKKKIHRREEGKLPLLQRSLMAQRSRGEVGWGDRREDEMCIALLIRPGHRKEHVKNGTKDGRDGRSREEEVDLHRP